MHLEDDILHLKHTARVQDQYSFRCLPQVHGSCRDQLEHAKQIVTRELNAATDNPLVFWNDRGALEFLSRAATSIASRSALPWTSSPIALVEIGNISERRLFALTDTTLNYGLPPNLAGRPIGLNYGYGIIATSAASVASENKSLAFPSVADTIPTKSNQEDHVAMATWGCRKARQVIDNMPKILGVECLLAARAIFLTEGALGAFELGAGSQAVYDALAREHSVPRGRQLHAEPDPSGAGNRALRCDSRGGRKADRRLEVMESAESPNAFKRDAPALVRRVNALIGTALAPWDSCPA